MEMDAGDNVTWETPELMTTVEPAVYVPKTSWLQNVCQSYTISLIVLMGILSVGGMVANTLTRLTLWPDRTKSATVVLIISLSIMDDLVLIFYGFMLMIFMASFVNEVRATDFPLFVDRVWTVGWAFASTARSGFVVYRLSPASSFVPAASQKRCHCPSLPMARTMYPSFARKAW